MFEQTHHQVSPWYVIQADYKKVARLNIISHLLAHIEFPDKDKNTFKYDPKIIFEFDESQAAAKEPVEVKF